MSFAEAALLAIFYFAAGRLIGHLTRNISTGKLLVLMLLGAGLFIVSIQMDTVQKTVFALGLLSHHLTRFFTVFSWAGNIGQAVSALRYRSAYEDIRRREKELDEREARLREEARRKTYQQREQESARQRAWQDQARGFRAEDSARTSNGDGGRGSGDSRGRSKRTGGEKKQSSGSQRAKQPQQDSSRAKHLQTLGLDPSKEYSPADIKKAWRRAAMKYHPDNQSTGESVRFCKVQLAWETLKG